MNAINWNLTFHLPTFEPYSCTVLEKELVGDVRATVEATSSSANRLVD